MSEATQIISKADAIKALEDRGIFVPREWSANKVRTVLAQVVADEASAPPEKVKKVWTPGSPRG